MADEVVATGGAALEVDATGGGTGFGAGAGLVGTRMESVLASLEGPAAGAAGAGRFAGAEVDALDADALRTPGRGTGGV
jgi:hypothetical protein